MKNASNKRSKSHRTMLGILAIGTVMVALPSMGLAQQTLTFSSSTTVQIPSNGQISAPGGGPISQFDPSLGTLQSVQIAYLAHMDASAGGTYIGPSGPVNVTLFGSDSFELNGNTYGPSFRLGSTSGFLQNGSFYSFPFTYDNSIVVNLTNPTDFNSYIGIGNLSWSGSASLALSGGPGSFTSQSFSGSERDTIQVTYTYMPVPEPATLAVVSLGAVGLLIRRKKH